MAFFPGRDSSFRVSLARVTNDSAILINIRQIANLKNQILQQQNTMTEKENQAARKISEETVLKVAKEITVKFIEAGRISPATFKNSFPEIYSTIKKTVQKQ